MVRENWKLGHFVGIGGLGGSGSVICAFSFLLFFLWEDEDCGRWGWYGTLSLRLWFRAWISGPSSVM